MHVGIVFAGGKKWEMTVVYASLNVSIRNKIWGKLNQMAVLEPWFLVGGFNCVTKGEERSSSKGVSRSFVSWLEHKGHIDMGFSGQIFTWHYSTSVETRRATRLDRGLCDDT